MKIVAAITIALVTTLLAACSTVPSSIEQSEEFVSAVEFNSVAQQPDAYEGKVIRWGGIIARVENLERDTLIEIVNLPLDRSARPVASQTTAGRFIARIPAFLDPIIYEVGSEITVVGQISQPMPGVVGKYEINFPVVDTSNHHLWAEREERQHLHSHHFVGFYSTWDPYWFGRHHYVWPYRYRYYPRFHYKKKPKRVKERSERRLEPAVDNRRSSIKRQPSPRPSAPRVKNSSRNIKRK